MTVIGPLESHTQMAKSVSFSSDGTRIVSGSVDQTVRVWDLQTRESTMSTWEGHTDSVKSLSFSSYGIKAVFGREGECRSQTEYSAGHIFSVFFDSPRTDDGWVLGPNSELLFWVPPGIRSGLCPLRNTLVLGGDVTQLDLTTFVHGEAWIRCRDRLAKYQSIAPAGYKAHDG